MPVKMEAVSSRGRPNTTSAGSCALHVASLSRESAVTGPASNSPPGGRAARTGGDRARPRSTSRRRRRATARRRSASSRSWPTWWTRGELGREPAATSALLALASASPASTWSSCVDLFEVALASGGGGSGKKTAPLGPAPQFGEDLELGPWQDAVVGVDLRPRTRKLRATNAMSATARTPRSLPSSCGVARRSHRSRTRRGRRGSSSAARARRGGSVSRLGPVDRIG